jgi:hypothetical protein
LGDKIRFGGAASAISAFPNLDIVEDRGKLGLLTVERFFVHRILSVKTPLKRTRLSSKVLSNRHPLRSIVAALEVEVFSVVHVVVSALSKVACINLKPILLFVVEIEVLLRLFLAVLHMHVNHRLAPTILQLCLYDKHFSLIKRNMKVGIAIKAVL